MKPTYLCIGAQKGGTTSFINYMNMNPDIYCHPEELHFFDKNYNYHENRIHEYEKKMNTHKKIIGEKTPSYGYLHYTINRIYKHYPDIKLVYILREPIARAFSQYNMVSTTPSIQDFTQKIQEDEKTDLSKITDNLPHKYMLTRGYYIEHIEHILTMFPPENLLIMISEESNKTKIKNITRFITS
jgi:hypothetical protein